MARWRTITALLLALAALAAGPAGATALDDYVHRPDSDYRWALYDHQHSFLADYYFLRLDSQQWLDASRVDRPHWVHELKIGQPTSFHCGHKVHDEHTALLIISGGGNRDDGKLSHDLPFLLAGAVANTFCRTVIELRQVPNQPLRFTDESFARREDALVAYSFDKFLSRAPGDWPIQMAMVKSVVQAMNAVQEFSRQGNKLPRIDDFVLLGTSKRGWTTWLTAAEDPRVRAIIPVSIDMLDLAQQFPHQFASYGGYGPALRDYEEFSIAPRMRSARGQALLDIVDPISYLDRLKQPKLIISSSGDEFFTSDSWRFYYTRLQGDNRLRYTINSNHRQGDNKLRYELIIQARNWLNDVLAGREPPRLDWTLEPDHTLRVKTSVPPLSVKLWQADNPEARDFRLDTLGPAWRATELRPDADGSYSAQLQAPAKGWRAALVEARFGPADHEQTYTTGIYVLPDTLPYAPSPPTTTAGARP